MKKFIVKYSNNNIVFGEFNTMKEASEKLIEHIDNYNRIYKDGEYYLTPFDFELEEKDDSKDMFETSHKYLVESRRNNMASSIEKSLSLLKDINPKHIDALAALNELFTIADEWNKEDNFEPDFSDKKQLKYFPKFRYKEDLNSFDVDGYTVHNEVAFSHLGVRLCFKTGIRAEQFGNQFIRLFNKILL